MKLTASLILSILLFLPALALGRNADVLLISSYHPGFPTFFQQIEGIKSVLEPQGVILDVEFMDSKRFNTPNDIKAFRSMLQAKLAKLPPYKVVVTSDDNALKFALDNRSELFPDTPVIFCGVNNQDLARSLGTNPDFTGVIEAVSMLETLEVMFLLHPQLTAVHAIVDTTPSGQGDLTAFNSLRDEFPDKKLNVISLDRLTWAKLAQRLNSLNSSDGILLLSAYKDAGRQSKSFYEGLAWIVANTKAPIYHLWEHGMGQGIVGGKLISHFEQGRIAGEMTLRILEGWPASELPVMEGNAANKFLFDHRLLKQYGIPNDLLPEGAEVQWQPVSLWETHRVAVLSTLLALSFLGGMTFLLILYTLRLRRTRAALKRSEERFQLAMEATSDGLWDWRLDLKQVYMSPGYFTMLGYAADELPQVYETWHRLLHPDDVAEVTRLVTDSIESGKGFRVEFRMRNKNGSWRWIMGRGKVIEWDDNGKASRMVGTHTDINEIKRIEMRLVRAKEAAEEANRTKDEFIANISHEVRTPLNGVMGMLQLLDDTEQNEEQADYTKTAYQSSTNLLRVLNDLLDFSKIEAGKMDLHEQVFDLQELVDGCLDLFRLQASERHNTLAASIDASSLGSYIGDVGRIRQVLFNLLGNAVKFTTDGDISLESYTLPHTEPDKLRLFFTIRDTGIGLTDEDVSKIFSPFTQVDGSLTRAYQGTGLGLPIVKKLVDLMRGSCTIISEPGKGTSVQFFVVVGAKNEAKTQGDRTMSPLDFKPLNVLLVEDEKVNRVMAQRLLEKIGHTVTFACNGHECLDILPKQSVDIILMDIQMPILDGHQTTQAIRLDPQFSNYADIPIIGLSAHASDQDRNTALDNGMNDYITKPFEKAELEQILLQHT